MNIYHQVLIPIFFLLTISIDESFVHSGILSNFPGLDTIKAFEHFYDHLMDNESEENEREKHYKKCKGVNSNEESGSKSSGEKSGSKSSGEKSGNESSDEKSGIANSGEKTGIKNSNEGSASKTSNEKNGNEFSHESEEKKTFKGEKKSKDPKKKNGYENSNENIGIKFSKEKNGHGNSNDKTGHENHNEKNGHENCNEQNEHENGNDEHGHENCNELNGHENFNEENGHESSNEKNGHENSNEKNGHETSNEKNGHENSNEKNGHETSNEKNGHENSNEKNGHEHSNEKNGHEHSNEKNGHEHSNEKNGHEHSNEKNGHENSNEKNGHEHSNEKNGHEHSNEKNGHENSNEKNGLENSNEKNEIKLSNDENEIQFPNEENEIKFPNEKNENENSMEKDRRKDDTDDNKFTVIVDNGGENPEEEYENGNSVMANLIGNLMEGEEIKSSTPVKYLNTVQAFHEGKIFQYPYHVTIVWKPDGRLLCQGALIKPGWIITSASCIYQYVLHYKTLTVLMGIATLRDTSVVSRDILEMVLYPAFIPEQSLNDLALLMLDGEVEVNENLRPVAISKPYDPNERKCQFSTFIGDTLYGENIDFVFQENCDVLQIEGQVLPYFCASINGSLINSSKRSTYGSPLVCGGVIYGIKSKNTLFSSVDTVIPWIDNMVQEITDRIKA